MEASDQQRFSPQSMKKLRSACDRCHQAKSKCTGGITCSSCADAGEDCVYSFQNRAGRPKGARNKRILEQRDSKRQNTGRTSISSSLSTELGEVASQLEYTSAALPLPAHAGLKNFHDLDGFTGEARSNTEFLDALSLPSNSIELWDFLQSVEHFGHDGNRPTENDGLNSSFDLVTVPQASQAGSQSSMENVQSRLPAPHTDLVETGLHPVQGGNEGYFSIEQPSMIASAPPAPMVIDHQPVCYCIQQHANLLCLLKGLDQRSAASPIHVVLTGIKHAIGPWQNLINCVACLHNNNNGGLVLSVITMRFIVHRLQDICADLDSSTSMSASTVAGKQLFAAEKVLIGNYEATGQEQKLVTDLLAMRALRQIKSTLVSLREQVEKSRGRNSTTHLSHHDSPASNSSQESHQSYCSEQEADTAYAQRLLLNLEAALIAIGNKLRIRNAAALQECYDGLLTS